MELEIKIKYHNKELPKIKRFDLGDWIDLRAAEDVTMKAGEYKLISLGVSMKLPEGYEAISFLGLVHIRILESYRAIARVLLTTPILAITISGKCQ